MIKRVKKKIQTAIDNVQAMALLIICAVTGVFS